MSVLLGILLWLLIAVLGIFGLAFVTPVFLRVHLTNAPLFAYRVEVHALGGLAPRLTLANGPGPDDAPKNRIKKNRTKQTKPKPQRSLRPKRVNGAVIAALPELIKSIARHVHVAELHIDADFGLGDPAQTGQLCGLLMPLQYASPLPASVLLDLRPDFTRTCLHGSLTVAVRLTVGALAVPALRFSWRAFGPGR